MKSAESFLGFPGNKYSILMQSLHEGGQNHKLGFSYLISVFFISSFLFHVCWKQNVQKLHNEKNIRLSPLGKEKAPVNKCSLTRLLPETREPRLSRNLEGHLFTFSLFQSKDTKKYIYEESFSWLKQQWRRNI